MGDKGSKSKNVRLKPVIGVDLNNKLRLLEKSRPQQPVPLFSECFLVCILRQRPMDPANPREHLGG
jgi:hypothetical protein